MAGFDDITKKATDFLNSDKTKDALRSEKAEDISDKVLGGGAGLADRVTGGKHSDKIEDLRESADKKIGTDGHTPTDRTDRPRP